MAVSLEESLCAWVCVLLGVSLVAVSCGIDANIPQQVNTFATGDGFASLQELGDINGRPAPAFIAQEM